MRHELPLFGFSGQDAPARLLIDILLGSLGKSANKLLVIEGPPRVEKGQKSVDLPGRQSLDHLVKPFQLTHEVSGGDCSPGPRIPCGPADN
jgi:hypothetical protein